MLQNDGADLSSISSEFENSSNIQPLVENILRYDCIMIVVSEVLTADSNSNNGWIGGTDASTEVSRSVSLGTMIHDNDIQGTWTWSDATQFSFANWWTGQFSLIISRS